MSKRIFLLVVMCFSLISVVNADMTLRQVSTKQMIRTTGTPTQDTFEFSLLSTGELRVTNESLIDSLSENAVETNVLVDGVKIINSFFIKPGLGYVWKLNAGAHTIKAILHGMPGGSITFTAFEDTQPQLQRGFEVLQDGTVLHKNTGLIWHRNPFTPGVGELRAHGDHAYGAILHYDEKYDYVRDINAGVYGDDPDFGNAGYSDWRLPTIDELWSVTDRRFSWPTISNIEGGGTVLEPYSSPTSEAITGMGYRGGMNVYGRPFLICVFDAASDIPGKCDDKVNIDSVLPWIVSGTLGSSPNCYGYHCSGVYSWGLDIRNNEVRGGAGLSGDGHPGDVGSVWLVRDQGI